MSPVKDADPDAASLDAAFAAAQGAPPRPKEPRPPAELDREAPHGRDDQGVPLEPYGRTKEGKIRLTRAGRPPKAEQARTAAPPADPPGPAVPDPKDARITVDYSAGLQQFADQAWFVGTMAAELPWSRIPLVSKIKTKGGVPLGERLKGAETRLHAQCHIFHGSAPDLVAALNISAQHSPRARRLAEKITTDGADLMWVFQVAMLLRPVADATVTLWAGQFDGSSDDQPAEKLIADANRGTFEDAKKQLVAQYTAAARKQQAELAAAAAAEAGQETEQAA